MSKKCTVTDMRGYAKTNSELNRPSLTKPQPRDGKTGIYGYPWNQRICEL